MDCPHPEKRVYWCQEDAEEAAKAHEITFGHPMRAYPCTCGRFHLTKQEKNKNKSRPTKSLSLEAKRRKRQNWKRNRRERDRAMKRTKYTFLYRAGDMYYWTARVPISPVESRTEMIFCKVDWFWGRI